MSTTHITQRRRSVVCIGIPLTLAVVETFHPQPHDLLQLDLDRWMAVHYAQIVLFPLAAFSACLLVDGVRGYAASLCRVAMFVFGVTFVGFDTAAGLVTGVLVRAARTSTSPETWREPVLAVWNHAVIGGRSDGAPALAVIGTMAWLVGSLSAAVALRRAGRSWHRILDAMMLQRCIRNSTTSFAGRVTAADLHPPDCIG